MNLRLLPSPPSLDELTLDQLREMIEGGLEAIEELRRRLDPEQPTRRLRLVDN